MVEHAAAAAAAAGAAALHAALEASDGRLVVEADGSFWRHTHSHNHNVYDFTTWTEQHPGGAAAITKFARLYKGKSLP